MARAGRLSGVLANALELHNMAISSTDMRVQFVTMWSALECLASVVPGESVISRVMNLLVPIVSWRRMEKDIRYLGLNLRKWRSATDAHKEVLESLPNATADEVPGEDVLMTVARPTNHPHMKELLGAVAAHPLLLWRTTTTWEVFHDPRDLAREMERARERLTWHIGRIYRVRNRLVHAGDDSPLLASLLENLQFYFLDDDFPFAARRLDQSILRCSTSRRSLVRPCQPSSEAIGGNARDNNGSRHYVESPPACGTVPLGGFVTGLPLWVCWGGTDSY